MMKPEVPACYVPVPDHERTIRELLEPLYPHYENLVAAWVEADERYDKAMEACAEYAFNAEALEAFCAHLSDAAHEAEQRHVRMKAYINHLRARIGMPEYDGGPIA